MREDLRVFSVAAHAQPSTGEPIRSVVLETAESVIVVWHLLPGQEITPHIHPQGQDTWTVLSGEAEYIQGGGIVSVLHQGDIAVAKNNQVHGAKNIGNEPFVFVSVVSPSGAGYEPHVENF
jgi:quercetin dioxygenase-like cupin family protein